MTDLLHNGPYEGPGKLSGNAFEDAKGCYELAVRDHFDAAHALPGYDGPCQYLHGHTWDVEVVVAGGVLDEVGMLYDFKDVKRDLHAVLDNFDHRCVNEVPPFDRLNPTAEHLARVVFHELAATLPAHLALKEVSIWESREGDVPGVGLRQPAAPTQKSPCKRAFQWGLACRAARKLPGRTQPAGWRSQSARSPHVPKMPRNAAERTSVREGKHEREQIRDVGASQRRPFPPAVGRRNLKLARPCRPSCSGCTRWRAARGRSCP